MVADIDDCIGATLMRYHGQNIPRHCTNTLWLRSPISPWSAVLGGSDKRHDAGLWRISAPANPRSGERTLVRSITPLFPRMAGGSALIIRWLFYIWLPALGVAHRSFKDYPALVPSIFPNHYGPFWNGFARKVRLGCGRHLSL